MGNDVALQPMTCMYNKDLNFRANFRAREFSRERQWSYSGRLWFSIRPVFFIL